MSLSADSFARSLWHATSKEPPLETEPLTGERTVDVAVVGGGFTGLSTALHLAESGVSVALCETREIGFGGSGRNGGQVIPGLKLDPDRIEAVFGTQAGPELTAFAGSTAERVFALIERLGIACDPVRQGWIQGAHAPRALRAVQDRARQWERRGVPVRLLDAEAIAALTGSTEYCGGWLDPRAGTVQPLAFARGLARAARDAGASIHQKARVERLTEEDAGWVLHGREWRIRARRVVIGTNAYTDDLWPGLAQSFLTVQSMIVATDPLPPALRSSVLPGGSCGSETRKLAFYFRRSPDDRVVFGGRGAVGPEERTSFQDGLIARMHHFFPATRNLASAFQWSGQVALTLDGLPHLHAPRDGLLVALGYNGRGVALATSVGQALAHHLLDGRALPLPAGDIASLPWHGLRKPAMALGVAWYWAKDRLGFAA